MKEKSGFIKHISIITLGAGLIGFFISATVRGALLPSQTDWMRFSVMTPAGPEEPSADVLKKLHPLVYTEHKVKYGEWNIWRMAKNYGTSVPALQATNNNELMFVNPGTRLVIPNKPGFLYFVKGDNETLDSIIAKYRKDPAQARKLKEKAVEINHLPGTALLAAYHLEPREMLLLPGVMPPNFDTYRFPFSDGGWTRISSGFGMRMHPVLGYRRRHDGWDLPKPYGTKVYPSRSGRIIFAGWKGGYGNMIEVRHINDESTVYGHLSKIDVKVGQWVERGKTLLGRVGSTGISTGPHLHFEMRDRYGHPINPRNRIGRR